MDIAAVGNVEAYTTIAVRSQVTGQLDNVFVHEGDTVKKGQQLFSIDRRPLESALQQAQANMVRDQALLSQAEAQLARDAANAEYQQLTAERQSSLVGRGIISKDAGEQTRASADATAATVKADKAAIESARAQLAVQQAVVDNAKVQLDYTLIRSPIDGRMGDVTVKAGNLVTANTSQLMTIAQLQPVYVTFSVPATHLPSIKAARAASQKLAVVATPQDADMQPADGDAHLRRQRRRHDDRHHQAEGDVRQRRPPAVARPVRARQPAADDAAATRPSCRRRRCRPGQDGQFVFVVKADSTVEQRPVTVGQRVDDDMVIEKGLKPGETVVTEGQLRLEQGTRVQAADTNGAPAGAAAADVAAPGGRRGGAGGRRGGPGRPPAAPGRWN